MVAFAGRHANNPEGAAEIALRQLIHRRATACRIGELPRLHVLHIDIGNVLPGGTNATLGRHRHGETLCHLLPGEIVVDVPEDVLPEGSPYLERAAG